MSRITLELVEDSKVILAMMTKALSDEITKKLKKLSVQMSKAVREGVKQAIESSPEYISLTTTTGRSNLQANFGFADGLTRMSAFLLEWSNNLKVIIEPALISGDIFKASIIVQAIDADFTDILGLSESQSVTLKGQSLPWLEWLLTAGNSPIIVNYRVRYGPFRSSRSGHAIMVDTAGHSWTVPSEFAGTLEANFVTRAIERSVADIESTLISYITAGLT